MLDSRRLTFDEAIKFKAKLRNLIQLGAFF